MNGHEKHCTVRENFWLSVVDSLDTGCHGLWVRDGRRLNAVNKSYTTDIGIRLNTVSCE
jgi:hypothetical protein